MSPKDWVGRIERWICYMPRTQRIICMAALFIAGLLLALVVVIPTGVVASVILISIGIFLRKYQYWIVLVGALMFFGGYFRGVSVHHDISQWQEYYDQKITIIAEAREDSSVGYRNQLEFDTHHISIERSGELIEHRGVIKVQGYGVASVRRGDIVRARGKLREAWGNRDAQLSFSDIEIIAHQSSFIETIRRNFFAGVYTAIPEPHASLGLGFLVGAKTVLPEELLDQLGRTGLTHIVAVSGYNLTILVRAMRRGFAKRSKFLSLAMSVGLIVSFIAVTGMSPSISRAAVVSALALSAWYYGRNVTPIVLLSIAAVVTAAVEPTYLWRDIGWYLSFLAFFGVLVLAPLITKRLFAEREPHWLTQILIETTSAQLLVVPLIAVIFGDVSLISLLANLIVLPLIPFAMVSTFIAGVVGWAAPLLVGWIAVPASAVLGMIISVVRILAGVHWASVGTEITWWHGSILYLSIAILLISLRARVGRLRDYNVIE